MILIKMMYGTFKHETMSVTEEDAIHAMEIEYTRHLERTIINPDKVLIEGAVREWSTIIKDKEIKDYVSPDSSNE